MRRRYTLDIKFCKDDMSVHDLKKVARTLEDVMDVYNSYVDDFDNDPHSAIDFFNTFGSHTSRLRTRKMVEQDAKEDA